MFSGIVEEIGNVLSLEYHDSIELYDKTTGEGCVLVISCEKAVKDAYLGCSIAINGTCLTVTKFTLDSLTFGVSMETLRRTNLGQLKVNDEVNVERSLLGRNSGHFVQGHVDDTGSIQHFEKEGDSLWVTIKVPSHLMQYIVPKGFISVDGTSLTVCAVNTADDCFSVMLVAYTQHKITLPRKRLQDNVNIEVDVMGKYASRANVAIRERLDRMEQRQNSMVYCIALGGASLVAKYIVCLVARRNARQ